MTDPSPHHSDPDLTLYKFPSGPLDNNSYLLVCPRTNESLVIDVPAEASAMLDAARRTDVRAILITHGHYDHVEGYGDIVPHLGADVYIGGGDAGDLPEPPGGEIEDGDEFTAGDVTLRAISTPGHTPGSTSFIIGRHLFTGDTLFPGGPGKSVSPEAFSQLVESVASRLLSLEGEMTVYPGHGADGSLADSRREYAVFASRSHPDDLYGDVAWLES